MENMDSLRERLEALEHQTKALTRQTPLVERRLRWWRGLACGMIALSLFSLALPWSTAQDTLDQRVAALEAKLAALRVEASEINSLRGPHVIFEGVNVHIRSGSGATDDNGTPTGLGNLIVGYNEGPAFGPPSEPICPVASGERSGAHNLIIGAEHRFTSVGGLVAGVRNAICGVSASVSGGTENTAAGFGGANSISGSSTTNRGHEHHRATRR